MPSWHKEWWPPCFSRDSVGEPVSPWKGWHVPPWTDPGGEVKVMTDLGVTASWWLKLQVSERESKVRREVGRRWNPEPRATLKAGGSPRRSS